MTSGTELVPFLDESGLEVARDPAGYVIAACTRAKAWLTAVLEQGDLEEIAHFKSQAEALRVFTMQKQLGHDAELAAAEIVRRAERGLGVAIRQGQEDGTVRSPRETAYRPRRSGTDLGEKLSPSAFLANTCETADVYAMTDGVSNEEFESGLREAKAEGNLSRANVVRKVTGRAAPPSKRSEWHRNAHHVNAERVLEETILALEAMTTGLRLADLTDTTPEQRADWQHRLLDATKAIRNYAFKELTV